MIKVCHMTSAHASQDVRILKKQCVSLAKNGYETYLVAKGESYEEDGVHVVGVGEISGGRLKRMTVATKLVYKKALELDCDIYQIHDPELLPYAVKLKKKGKKVIFDSHENIIDSIHEKEYLPKTLRSTIAKVCDSYLNSCVKKFDAVITVTPHIVDYYKKITDKVYMITNYPHLISVEAIENKDRSIVFAGGISKQWNHINTIKAIQNIDVKYNLCGANNSYLEQAKLEDKNNKLNYLGKVSHKESLKIQSESMIGMTLLEYNLNAGGKTGTIGNTKIFEYMMSGLPIICTDFILWKEIVDKYKCGIYVNPNNIDEISKAISYLLDNPKEASEMGENGRLAIENEYNWDIEVQKLFKLYEDV